MHTESFNYTYSAPEQQEILNIRSKYLPKEESKLEELKRLDRTVQSSGITVSLSIGIISCLVFGLGLCFCLDVLGSARWPGILLGALGMAGMLLAYPLQKKLLQKAKQKYASRILELSAELCREI